jgi:hypothetical protein
MFLENSTEHVETRNAHSVHAYIIYERKTTYRNIRHFARKPNIATRRYKMSMSYTAHKWWYDRIVDLLRDVNYGVCDNVEDIKKRLSRVHDGIILSGYSNETYRELLMEALATETFGPCAMMLLAECVDN